ncbi:hypothetical protein MMC12_000171 [Toensbergia leucococca]|nr:hypothetical protein [Toensbergia leucococca]
MSPAKVKNELRILTPIGMIGYGFSEDLFWTAMEEGVDAIIADCGSTDSGPQKLALGSMTVTLEAYVKDLAVLVAAAHKYKVPILLGSAGGDGANSHVDMFVEIIAGIIKKRSYRPMKIISIYAEIEKDLIRTKHKAGLISGCGSAVPILNDADIDDATRVVAQMGLEPYLKAMEENPDFDIIVGGRAFDPAPYAAFCVYNGFPDLGIAYHMGKIMECGALCAKPKCREALAVVRHDSFDLAPLNPIALCTVNSVAAHSLYEKTRPDILLGPGGALHLEKATYEQLPDRRTVRVRGAVFKPVEEGQYTIKMEGARVGGFRSVFIGGIRDPILIAQIDKFIPAIKAYVKGNIKHEYDLNVHIYGKNAIMGPLEPDNSSNPKEICICAEAQASTQEQATNVVSLARIAIVHGPYPHQLATAGNFAMPFAPYDIPLGRLCEFCIYHLMVVEDPTANFPIHVQVLQPSEKNAQNDYDEAEVTKETLRTLSRKPENGDAGSEDQNGSTPTMNGNGTAPAPANKPIVTPATKDAAFNEQLQHSSRASDSMIKERLERSAFLTPAPPADKCYLGDLASVIRSKNAGPYELTFDVMFDDDETYELVKAAGVLSRETISRLYQVPDEEVIACLFWDPARAFKATIKRPFVEGQFGEADIHGSQQHVPLIFLLLPIPRPSM